MNHIIILVQALTRTYLILHYNDSSMQFKKNLYVNLREIKELGLNQVFYKKKKKKTFNQQTKVSMHVIKDNSISLLEFVFDLNFDEIIFPKNPNKIVQNKDKDFFRV